MPTPANGEREQNNTPGPSNTELEQLRRELADKEREISTLQERYEEEQMKEMEARWRERRQLESREEEIEHLQEQLRHQGRRPTEALHQTSIIQWWFKFLTFINLQKLSDKMAIYPFI